MQFCWLTGRTHNPRLQPCNLSRRGDESHAITCREARGAAWLAWRQRWCSTQCCRHLRRPAKSQKHFNHLGIEHTQGFSPDQARSRTDANCPETRRMLLWCECQRVETMRTSCQGWWL